MVDTAEPIVLDLPITTKRLVLRAPVVDDVTAFHQRRNEPQVALYQDWTTPFALGEAQSIVNGASTMAGPTPGQWWMLTVVAGPGEDKPGEIIGDVAIHLDASGTISELGYSLAPPFWRRGYATEAIGAVVDILFASRAELVRIEASMHPDNLASQAASERNGFVYEGRARLGFPPRHEGEGHSDGVFYSLTRADHERWQNRPTSQPDDVALVEVTSDNLGVVFDLATHKTQEGMVAPVSYSLAQALHPPSWDGKKVEAWHRAVVADSEIVGFVMLSWQIDEPPYLWRLLIDRRHQRRGIGRRVLDLVVEEVKGRGATRLDVSWVPGPGSPADFYTGYGFEPGDEPDEDGEIPGVLSV